MKKIFIVLVVCVLIVVGVLYFTSNPEAISNIALNISNIFETPDEPYTSDFYINNLKIKTNTYYYEKLTEPQKLVYTSIANGVKALSNEIKLKQYEYIDSNTTMRDVEEALHKFLLDHPEVYYVDDKYTVSTSSGITGTTVLLNFTYQYATLEELNSSLSIIENKLDEIISSVSIEPGKDFENEQKLHDILSNKVKYYEYTDVNQIPDKYHNVLGTLTENLAVCDGLAKTMQLLLDKVGIESIIVSGKLNNTSHAWNMIKLYNEWYHLDVTSDNSVKTENKVVIHSYFNLTTDAIKKTHTIANEELIPEAVSDKYNFYIYTGKNITKDDNFSTKLKEIIQKNQDSKIVEYRVSGFDEVPEKTIEVLRKNKFTDYLEAKSTKFIYYNVLDTYIILKK